KTSIPAATTPSLTTTRTPAGCPTSATSRISEQPPARSDRRGRTSDLVVLPVPGHELRHALFHRHDGPVADVGDQVGDIRLGVGHVARLQRQHLHLRLA